MIKAVIFDCFGVLINGAFDEVYRNAGGDPVKDDSFIDDLLGEANLGLISSQQMSQRVTGQLGISQEQWQQAINSTQYPSQAMLDYATQLKRRYKIAILSNANVGTLTRKFSPEQLDLFDTVIVSAEVGMMKPDPEIYELAAHKLGVQPAECVFIDDSPGLSQAAKVVGMQAICFRDIEQLKRELTPLLDLV